MSSISKLSTFPGAILAGPDGFPEWRSTLELWLVSNDLLWLYVDGPCTVAPSVLKATHAQVQAELEQAASAAGMTYKKQAYHAEPGVPASDSEWSLKRMVCFAAISLSVSPECRKAIKSSSKNDPAAALDDLTARYGTEPTSTRILLFRRLLSSRKPVNKSWSAWYDELTSLVLRAYADGPLSMSEFVSMALILSAPTDWAQTMSMISHKHALSDPDSIVMDLTGEEALRKQNNEEIAHAQAQAFAAKTTHHGSNKYGDECTNPICVKFGRIKGHDLSHCFEDGGGMASKHPAWFRSLAAKYAANIATASSSSSTPVTTPAVTSTPRTLTAFVEEITASGDDSDDSSSSGVSLGLLARTATQISLSPRIALVASRTTSGVADTGANDHFESDVSRFVTYEPLAELIYASGMFGQGPPSIGIGEVHYRLGKGHTLKLSGVLHTPGAQMSLISISKLCAGNPEIGALFDSTGCVVRRKGSHKVLAQGTLSRDGLYMIQDISAKVAYAARHRTSSDLLTWHNRLGHVNMDALVKLARTGEIPGLQLPASFSAPICEHCLAAKGKVQPFPRETENRATRPLERVVCDITGPVDTESLSRKIYALNAIDDFSGYITYDFLRHKNDAAAAHEQRFSDLEAIAKTNIGCVRTDGGGEFEKSYEDLLSRRKIVHETTAPESSSQNGLSERAHQTIGRRASAMLRTACLPKTFWAEAWSTAAYVANRLPSRRLNGETPYEAFHGSKPQYVRIREFGCTCYVVLSKKKRQKVGDKAQKCIFLGYYEHSKAYRCWDPATRSVVKSRNVTFIESKDLHRLSSSVHHSDPSIIVPEPREPSQLYDTDDDTSSVGTPDDDVIPPPATTVPVPDAQAIPPPAPPVQEAQFPVPEPGADVRRSGRTRVPSVKVTETLDPATKRAQHHVGPRLSTEEAQELSDRLNERRKADNLVSEVLGTVLEEGSSLHGFLAMASDMGPLFAMHATGEYPDRIPFAYEQAVQSPYGQKWLEAMGVEIQSMNDHDVWEVVPASSIPADRKIVDSRWVYDLKHDENGLPVRYKARLVAKGFTQRPGFDYFETSSPTCRPESVCTILALACYLDWETRHLDIKTTFLNGELDEEIYMRQPKGFEVPGDHVLRLCKAIYGLKQAGLCWYKKLKATLVELGYTCSVNDPCVFYRRDANRVSIIAVHVDDMKLVGSSTDVIREVVEALEGKFTITDLGESNWFLGMKIARNRMIRTMTISQRAYTKELLRTFHMQDCTPVSTPAVPGKYLADGRDLTPAEHDQMSRTPFKELVGSLTWLAIVSRPDIQFALTQVSQYTANPKPWHFEAAKRILRYLRGTLDHGICFGPPARTHSSPVAAKGLASAQTAQFHAGHDARCYTDVDWANCPDSRCSVSGYSFLLNDSLISWSSRKQKTIALSSTEAETQAAKDGGKEAIWLGNLLRELGALSDPIPLHLDNQGTIALATGTKHHDRSKNFAVHTHWLRERVAAKDFTVLWTPTNDMLADIFTKPLSPAKHKDFCDRLGLRSTRGGVLA